MEHLLIGFVAITLLIVLISVLNEKFIKMPNDIALLLFSCIFSGIFKLLSSLGVFRFDELLIGSGSFRFDEFLMNGILCFMLFAGASKVHFSRFLVNIKPISLLALLSTAVSAILFGGIFFAVASFFDFGLSLWECMLLGCIVAPTDPIAATGILNKAGLSKSVLSIIESESLFNDGVALALFIFVKNVLTSATSANPSVHSLPVLIAMEFGGAVVVGLIVSFLLFKLLKYTKDPMKHILISLLTVSLSYVVCEHLGFSGAIASVICGMYFAKQMEKCERWRTVVDPENFYGSFWEILEMMLNSILYVLIGISIFYLPIISYIPIIICTALIGSLLARYFGVTASAVCIGVHSLPSKYNLSEFVSLLTWTALRGGVSLALALSTAEFLSPEVYEVVLLATYVIIFFSTVCQGLTSEKVFHFIENKKLRRVEKTNEVK